MKIGYTGSSHNHKRNIIGVVPEAEYQRVIDQCQLLSLPRQFLNTLAKRTILDTTDLRAKFQDFNLNRVDLLHLWNGISSGSTPWIVTFETIVPRFRKNLFCHYGKNPDLSELRKYPEIAKAVAALSRPSCARIIALSECNLNIQREFLRYFPEYRETVEQKLTSIHPPQRVIVDSYERKGLSLDGKLKFMFVGAGFFRKGGMEILEALKNVREQNGYDLELTIVSSLGVDPIRSTDGEQAVNKARALIQASVDWITYYRRLPNREVVELMTRSHVGLLPTYADTYGYSVLEFQAAGCPVITTNVRALPEINNHDVGWLINVPVNRLGEAALTSPEDKYAISKRIVAGLENAVHEIFANRDEIVRKSDRSIERIRATHSSEDFAGRMRNIYHEALQ